MSLPSLPCLTLPSHMALSSSHSPSHGSLLDTGRNIPRLDHRCTEPRSGMGTGVRRCVCLRGKKKVGISEKRGVMWPIQFKHSPSNPVGMEKWQELPPPLQQALAAIEVQCLCGASQLQSAKCTGLGVQRACHPTNLHDVKMLCMPSGWPVQTLWHREASEARGRESTSHLLKAGSPGGSRRLCPEASHSVGKAITSSAPFPKAGWCHGSSCHAAREQVPAA